MGSDDKKVAGVDAGVEFDLVVGGFEYGFDSETGSPMVQVHFASSELRRLAAHALLEQMSDANKVRVRVV